MLRALLFSMLVLIVSGAAHALVVTWALRSFPSLAPRARRIWWATAAIVVATPLARWAALAFEANWSARFHAATMIETAIVVLCALPLGLLRAGVRFTPRPVDPSRRKAIETIGGAAVLGATTSAIGWGIVRGRHAFSVEEIVVKIPNLPRVLDGYVIAQVSDIHAGVFVDERELAEGLSRVREVKPDLIVATGDLVDYDQKFIPLLARSLADLRARDGVTAILGNHDYYTGARAVLAGLRAAGVRTLVNEGVIVRGGDGGGFALLGVADLYTRQTRSLEEQPSFERAIATVPPDRPRILLAHQPRFFPEVAGDVALQLSGHTHGGQINPGFRPADLFMEFVAGRYEKNGSTLYVNRGFGVAGPPSRIGAPPEVTKIVLVSG